MIYFDNNSTTRVFEGTVEAMVPYMTQQFANPASAVAHVNGVTRVLQTQKSELAKVLGAERGDQFVVTSGATESNNLALAGAALDIRLLDGRARCQDCATEFATETIFAPCPCGSRHVVRLQGEELNIKAMELEEAV